jgi:hypothetical protein
MRLKIRRFYALKPILCSVSLLWLIVSCNDLATEPASTTISNILPLSVGNTWLDFQTTFDSLGRVRATTSTSLEINGDTLIGGHRWFHVVLLNDKIANRNTESGASVRLVSPNSGDNEGIQYKQPCSRGESYPFAIVRLSPEGHRVTVDSEYICTVKSVDTIITVPAGSFHCIHYYVLEYGGAFSWDDFLAPGWGWIKQVRYHASSRGGRAYVSSISETTSIQLH